MKKISFAFLIAQLLTSSAALATMSNVYNVLQTQNATPFNQMAPNAPELNIETPYRCQTNGFHTQQISTTLPVNLNDFKLIKITKTDPLPRYEVNGYTFTDKPIDEAIQTLVDEAGILVYTEDSAYPSLSAQNLYGDLESVVRALLENVDMYFSYNETTQNSTLQNGLNSPSHYPITALSF